MRWVYARLFLSTLSLRRATGICLYSGAVWWHFYPRSPCGERRFTGAASTYNIDISIHALLAESDERHRSTAGIRFAFLSTLSLRRATTDVYTDNYIYNISIHALLAESDITGNIVLTNVLLFLSTLSLRRATGNPARRPIGRRHFYPRSPCGERPNWAS